MVLRLNYVENFYITWLKGMLKIDENSFYLGLEEFRMYLQQLINCFCFFRKTRKC